MNNQPVEDVMLYDEEHVEHNRKEAESELCGIAK